MNNFFFSRSRFTLWAWTAIEGGIRVSGDDYFAIIDGLLVGSRDLLLLNLQQFRIRLYGISGHRFRKLGDREWRNNRQLDSNLEVVAPEADWGRHRRGYQPQCSVAKFY